MRYFRRPWDEPRGDAYDHWGTSTWYLEVGDDLFISRQIEVYADGTVLKYDEFHPADAYGGLGDQPIHVEADGFLPFEIGRAEFEQAWATTVAKNR